MGKRLYGKKGLYKNKGFWGRWFRILKFKVIRNTVNSEGIFKKYNFYLGFLVFDFEFYCYRFTRIMVFPITADKPDLPENSKNFRSISRFIQIRQIIYSYSNRFNIKSTFGIPKIHDSKSRTKSLIFRSYWLK